MDETGLVALARDSLAHYDIEVRSLAPVRLSNNAVFRVETPAGTYALRLHRPGYRALAHTQAELTLLGALGEVGLGVPPPVRTREGDLIVPVGDRHADLTGWLPGEVRRPGRGLGVASAFAIGALVARVHRHASQRFSPGALDLPTWDADGLLSFERSAYRPGPVGGALTAADLAEIAEVRRRLEAAFDDLGQGPGAFGVVHGDLILGHCRFQGHRPHLIDFDDCGWGYFPQDLAPLLGNLRDFPRHRPLERALLEGYRSVRPLPPGTERHLDLLVAARHAASCLWAIGSHRGGGLADLAGHLAYRMAAVRDYLARG